MFFHLSAFTAEVDLSSDHNQIHVTFNYYVKKVLEEMRVKILTMYASVLTHDLKVIQMFLGDFIPKLSTLDDEHSL